MVKASRIFFSLGLFIFLFFITIFPLAARAATDSPKITKLLAQETLALAGTAPANSEVLIYLDGIFIGRTEAVFSCSLPAISESQCRSNWQFQFNPALKIADGAHAVMAVAQDKTSLVLSAPTSEIKFTINQAPAPTLIAPNEKTITADLKPLITGLTKDNSSVKIFIDGIYNGQTGILRDDSGTADFFYKPVFALSRGWHKIQARAESGGQTSSESNVLNFKIELPMPAPTIFQPVINRQTSANRPFIVGLAKNDSKIKIYLDKKYQGELMVKNHLSGTANFAFKPAGALARGAHSVYALAIDKRGKASAQSNAVNFTTRISAIAQSAQAERKAVAAKIKESIKPAETKPEPVVISESSGAVVKKNEVEEPAPAGQRRRPAGAELEAREQAIKQALKDKEKAALAKVASLIGDGAAGAKSDQGMINEGRQNQGKLKLNLILFIFFLLGVVAWLLWVNRELVKERRAQTEAEERAEKEKNLSNGGPASSVSGQNNKLF